MKELTNLIIIAVICLAVFTGCNQKTEKPQVAVVVPTFDKAAAKAAIEDVNQKIMGFIAAGDSTGMSNLYTADAKLMLTGAPGITGKEQIRAALSGIMKSGITSGKITTSEVWGNEEYLTEEGELSLFAGDAKVFQGKYIVLWKKEGGEWKLLRDIFNSDLPAG